MKKEDLDNLKQQLADLEKQVAELKQENPDDDYTEIDQTLDQFRNMINEGNIKVFQKRIIKRRLLSFFLNFLFHFIATFSVLGFCVRFINSKMIDYVGLIIPISALIIFIVRKVLKKLIFDGPLHHHKILYNIALYFIFACIMAILDAIIIGIFESAWLCVLTIIIIGVVLDIGEFIYYRKLVMKYRR